MRTEDRSSIHLSRLRLGMQATVAAGLLILEGILAYYFTHGRWVA
jgi:hypothetical protein